LLLTSSCYPSRGPEGAVLFGHFRDRGCPMHCFYGFRSVPGVVVVRRMPAALPG
jgi:hypothetical protein